MARIAKRKSSASRSSTAAESTERDEHSIDYDFIGSREEAAEGRTILDFGLIFEKIRKLKKY